MTSPDPSDVLQSPGLTVALALALGLACQVVAQHLRLPGLLVLLGAGVLVGPDVLGLVHPESLGAALPVLVNFAVAIILFEGGLNLNWNRIRRAQRSIQLLISVGALVTAVGGTLAAHYIMGWDWPVSAVFGTLVIVTGPTVINPLLKRIKVERTVATVLEAEGVLIDAVGAIAAAAALEFAVSGGSDVPIFSTFVLSLGFGAGMGLACGYLLALLLRFRNLVPEGLENVFTLAVICALFQAANALQHESGIAAVTVAGVIVGNAQTRIYRELREFKEQLTVMFIGMLFILLAADVGLEDVANLGWPGVCTVAVLMFVVRPLTVFTGTIGSRLSFKQRAFIGWIGPRGIVAAAVASLVASELGSDHPVGAEFRALVFSVIATTVVSAGLTGGPLARVLGLQRVSDDGWVILGANVLARTFARVLQNAGETAVCIDRNHDATMAAEAEGIRVVYGNGLEERTLHRAEIDTRVGAIGLSPSGEVNLLFVQKARQEAKLKTTLVGLSTSEHGVTPAMVHEAGSEVLFDHPDDLDAWMVRLRQGLADLQDWIYVGTPEDAGDEAEAGESAVTAAQRERFQETYIFLILHRNERARPVSDSLEFKKGDRVSLLVDHDRAELAGEHLASLGWQPAELQPASNAISTL